MESRTFANYQDYKTWAEEQFQSLYLTNPDDNGVVVLPLTIDRSYDPIQERFNVNQSMDFDVNPTIQEIDAIAKNEAFFRLADLRNFQKATIKTFLEAGWEIINSSVVSKTDETTLYIVLYKPVSHA